MDIWIIAIIVVLVLGIVLISGVNFSSRKKSREDRLKDLAHLWEGELKPLAGYENSHSISFKFEGRGFEFEDIYDKGFQNSLYRGFLRTRTGNDLTISFTEAPRATIKTEIFQASKVQEPSAETVNVPRELKAFKIYSNRPKWVNALFRDYRNLDVFLDVMGAGARGEPVMPLKVQKGIISLEFTPSHLAKANLDDILQNTSKLERFVKGLNTLALAIEAEHSKDKE